MNKIWMIGAGTGLIIVAALGTYAIAHVAMRAAPLPAVPQVATTTGEMIATSTPEAPSGSVRAPLTQPRTGGTDTLSVGEKASFTGVTVSPTRIVEDSRCPLGVMCIQAGKLTVSFNVETQKGSDSVSIDLGSKATVLGYVISFDGAEPVKRRDQTISDSDYRITFSTQPSTTSTRPCYVGGCSSQICSDSPGAISTCEYRGEYGCYRTATCERQASGSCGWTQTPQLTSCLAHPPAL